MFDYESKVIEGALRVFDEGLFGIYDENCHFVFTLDGGSPLGMGNSASYIQSGNKKFKLSVDSTTHVTTLVNTATSTTIKTWTPSAVHNPNLDQIYLSDRGDIHAGGL